MEKKFKAFDKVLVRGDKGEIWKPHLYGYWDEKNQLHVTISYLFVAEENILPYDGNEELVGTNDEPQIPLSEKRIQDAYWNNCTEKEKENLRNSYNVFLKNDETGKFILEKTCGKHNLQIDPPDEEVKLENGEYCFFCSDVEQRADMWIFDKFNRLFGNQFYSIGSDWNYAIRFKDFDPYDMEETQKHILCVKNGKIIRYKG